MVRDRQFPVHPQPGHRSSSGCQAGTRQGVASEHVGQLGEGRRVHSKHHSWLDVPDQRQVTNQTESLTNKPLTVPKHDQRKWQTGRVTRRGAPS